MSDDRHPVQALFGQLIGPGVTGRPQGMWTSIVFKAVKSRAQWTSMSLVGGL